MRSRKSPGLLGGEGKRYKKMNGHGIASVFLAGLLLDPYCGGIGLWLSLPSCLLALSALPPVPSLPSFSQWPPVTVLKPICGLEKNLRINLRSTCPQDYPDFQVVFSVGGPDDPAVPL